MKGDVYKIPHCPSPGHHFLQLLPVVRERESEGMQEGEREEEKEREVLVEKWGKERE